MEVDADVTAAGEEIVAAANEMINVNMQFTVNLTWSNVNNSTHGVV